MPNMQTEVHVPIFDTMLLGALQGSCGYGVLDREKWPYWSVGALATSNMFYAQGPVQGCG